MRRSLSVAAAVALLSGCTATSQPPQQLPTDTSAAMKDVTTRKLQNRWGKCLTSSYGITVKQTPDKNAAAEMAIRACVTEEHALASFAALRVGEPWASDTMASLKAGMKQMLVEDGRVPELPEQ